MLSGDVLSRTIRDIFQPSLDAASALCGHRDLFIELVKREFAGRYRGSFGGVLWSLAQPIFLLGVYTLAFSVILQARWGLADDTKTYAFHLFAGLLIFNVFAECLRRAPSLITANPNFVKKVVFPLEILPVVVAANALTHALVGFAVWIAGYAFLIGVPKATVLLFPILGIVLLPILLGLGWLLSAIGVFVKDVDHLTGLATHALLFLTPIFYSIDVAPAALRPVLMLNPLTLVVEEARALLLIGQAPDLASMFFYFLIGALFASASLWLFRRLRPAFADLV